MKTPLIPIDYHHYPSWTAMNGPPLASRQTSRCSISRKAWSWPMPHGRRWLLGCLRYETLIYPKICLIFMCVYIYICIYLYIYIYILTYKYIYIRKLAESPKLSNGYQPWEALRKIQPTRLTVLRSEPIPIIESYEMEIHHLVLQ